MTWATIPYHPWLLYSGKGAVACSLGTGQHEGFEGYMTCQYFLGVDVAQ